MGYEFQFKAKHMVVVFDKTALQEIFHVILVHSSEQLVVVYNLPCLHGLETKKKNKTKKIEKQLISTSMKDSIP